MHPDKERKEYHVRSVQRALHILDCFLQQPLLGVSEIAACLSLHKSTVHALLVTMEDEGYVKKDGDKYRLTYRLFRLGAAAAEGTDLCAAARPHLKRLCEATGESAALNVRDGTRRMVLEVAENPAPVRLYLKPGQRLHLHASAAGKVLLCELPAQELERIFAAEGLPAVTPGTITDREALLEELRRVREQGYALCSGEGYWDAGSVGAPVRDAEGTVAASVTVYGPLQHYSGQRLQNYIRDTLRCALDISRELGFDPALLSPRPV